MRSLTYSVNSEEWRRIQEEKKQICYNCKNNKKAV